MGARNADPSKIPPPQPGDKLSLRKFAALVGVDYVSAREALQNGRINFEPGTRLLDWDTQSAAFNATRILPDDETNAPASSVTFQQAKVRKEVAVASIKELELGVAKGQFLEKEQVKLAMYKWARTIRDAVLTIPDRVSAEVASQINAELRGDKKQKATDADIERIIRNAWAKEQAAVLEAIEKTPTIKPPKKKVSDEESPEHD